MIYINGYSSKWAATIGATPLGGRLYWASDLSLSIKILQDFNIYFIDPKLSLFCTSEEIFHSGYEFARMRERQLLDHILLSGNRLVIVSHGLGYSFAEGLATWLYEEKGIQAEMHIALQPNKFTRFSYNRRAVDFRLLFSTVGDTLSIPAILNRKSKMHEGKPLVSNYFQSIVVEKPLSTGFTKYSYYFRDKENPNSDSVLFLRKSFGFLDFRKSNRLRQFNIWTAIAHSFALLTSPPIKAKTDKDTNHVNLTVFPPHFQN